jgi:hypothetical protein
MRVERSVTNRKVHAGRKGAFFEAFWQVLRCWGAVKSDSSV